jgi:alpha-galactosidase
VTDQADRRQSGQVTGPAAAAPPVLVARPGAAAGTALLLIPRPDRLPDAWAGPVTALRRDGAAPPGDSSATAGSAVADPVTAGQAAADGDVAGQVTANQAAADHVTVDGAVAGQAVAAAGRCGLLPEHAAGWFGRPGLTGYRLGAPGDGPAAGRDWSPLFGATRITGGGDRARIEAADHVAGLALATDVEAVPGGAVRCRHSVTNTGAQPYVVAALDVVVPVPAAATEALDFTGDQLAERTPQRHPVTDGLWLREGRRGRTGHDSPTVLVAGEPGLGFGHGQAWGVHVAWSGNTVYRLERLRTGVTTVGGGELLLPGEVALARGETYTTPWVYVAAGTGLDELAAQFHGYARSLPAHPATPRPVSLNVWEAVYFDHDLARLTALADVAADLGVERYVLDDGWFRGRRDDRAGLGDWWVDDGVWPGGLHPLVDHVRRRGLQFGLWIEPEMVNPDSGLFRAHPDWILATGQRVPALQRNQLVLDLTRAEVRAYLLERISALLAEYDIAAVKWDHNRDLLDAGSGLRAGAAAVHDQTLAYYALLDELRRRFPAVEWESCASGGGRVDLGVLERVERFWTSDMTDALARQAIQRWTGQLVPPEYLGAHVSAPFSHQTGRYLPLGLRAATALFGHFGIEWDLTAARRDSPAELAELGDWIALYRARRGLLHTGRVIRVDLPDETAWAHGVVAADRSAALLSYVQLDEPRHRRPAAVRVPGLDARRDYDVADVTPGPGPSALPSHHAAAPVAATRMSGAALAQIGLAVPARRPLTAVVLHVTAASGGAPG